MTARVLLGDVFGRMAEIPDDGVDLLITSPPFLALTERLAAVATLDNWGEPDRTATYEPSTPTLFDEAAS